MKWRNRNNKSDKVINTTQSHKVINNDIKFTYDVADVVDMLNKLPASYYDDTKLWMSVTSALKSANLREQWEVFSKKSDKYDEANNESIWTGLQMSI